MVLDTLLTSNKAQNNIIMEYNRTPPNSSQSMDPVQIYSNCFLFYLLSLLYNMLILSFISF